MAWTRKRKKYRKPRKSFDKPRIEEENKIIREYGLKNKKEIWKAEAAIGRIRNQAKSLITASREEQEILIKKLNKIGFKVGNTADILALTKEDWLKRRLQTLLVEKKRIKPREARQLIVHKHVSVDGKKINVPGYMVKVDEEDKIDIIKKARKPKATENVKEKKEAKPEEKTEEKLKTKAEGDKEENKDG